MQGGAPTAMIVDDEAPARARLANLLDDTGGWSVVAEASNGKQALEYCQQNRPDVVLLDIRMPEMDGIEVASHLAALPAPPAVIFTTAYDKYALQAFKISAVDFLLKPVHSEALVQAIEKVRSQQHLKNAEKQIQFLLYLKQRKLDS